MEKLKQKLITFLMSNYKGSVRPAKNGNGIKVYADISAHLTQIEDLCEKCDLSVITTEPSFNPSTGKRKPAETWIGKRSASKDFTESDYLANL